MIDYFCCVKCNKYFDRDQLDWHNPYPDIKLVGDKFDDEPFCPDCGSDELVEAGVCEYCQSDYILDDGCNCEFDTMSIINRQKGGE